jgi:hypothetical protein
MRRALMLVVSLGLTTLGVAACGEKNDVPRRWPTETSRAPDSTSTSRCHPIPRSR